MTVTKFHVVRWLNKSAAIIAENKAYLTELDRAIGDADHGANMDRGFRKVVEKLPSVANTNIGNILKTTGMTLISTVGGAAGPLYGTFYMRGGMAVSSRDELDSDGLVKMLQGGIDGIVQRGRTNLADKTMLDTWAPALEALQESLDTGGELLPSLTAAVAAGKEGMESTIPMQAKKGRASYLGERSIGHQDPGATSSYLILSALLQTLQEGAAA